MTNPAADISAGSKDQIYLGFYSLEEPPFSITPDPEFLFLSNTHQSAIDKILYGINSKAGFMLLTGDIGTGKTTICRSILDRLDGNADTVYIINPSLSGKELISSILDDLGIQYSPDLPKKALIDHLNTFLLSTAHIRPVVVIIDDAQTMSVAALEDLRLLSNLETDKDKLLQMLLVGQPEFLNLLSRPEMRQLKQRVLIKCHLEYLRREETEGYIQRRLFIAGDNGRIRFTPGAIRIIYKASKGTPRIINKICDYALISGFVENEFTIGRRHVKKALTELGDLDFREDFTPVKKPGKTKAGGRRLTLALTSILTLLIGVLLLNQFYNLPVFRCERHENPALYAWKDTLIVKKKISTQEPDDIISKDTHRRKTPGQKPNNIVSKDTPKAQAPVSSPFALGLASFRSMNLSRAMKAVSIYKKRGIDVHWNGVDLGEKGTWLRLFTGRFTTRAEAVQFKKDYGLDKSIVLYAPWTVLAGQANSPEDLDQIRSLLKNNEYDGFTETTGDGIYRLLIGAFVTREGAEKLGREIKKLGIVARVVER